MENNDDWLAGEIVRLDGLSADALRGAWETVNGSAPPKGLGRSLMVRGITYTLQEQKYGGLSASARRELAKLASQLEGSGDLDVERQLRLKPGTRLVREWHGRTCQVMVMKEGFAFEDRLFGSLTQIAREVTGAKWSGPRFFGLTTRAKARSATQALTDA